MIRIFKVLLNCFKVSNFTIDLSVRKLMFEFIAEPEDFFKLNMLEEIKSHFWKLPPQCWFLLANKYNKYNFILENAKNIITSIKNVLKPKWKEIFVNVKPEMSEYYTDKVISFLRKMDDDDIIVSIVSEERSYHRSQEIIKVLKSKDYTEGFMRNFFIDTCLKYKYVDEYCSTLENADKYYAEIKKKIEFNFVPTYEGILNYGSIEDIKKIIHKVKMDNMYILIFRGYEIYKHFATEEISKRFSYCIASSDLRTVMDFYVKNELNREKDIKSALEDGKIENALFIEKKYN